MTGRLVNLKDYRNASVLSISYNGSDLDNVLLDLRKVGSSEVFEKGLDELLRHLGASRTVSTPTFALRFKDCNFTINPISECSSSQIIFNELHPPTLSQIIALPRQPEHRTTYVIMIKGA